jgi:hypothetical protein
MSDDARIRSAFDARDLQQTLLQATEFRKGGRPQPRLRHCVGGIRRSNRIIPSCRGNAVNC